MYAPAPSSRTRLCALLASTAGPLPGGPPSPACTWLMHLLMHMLQHNLHLFPNSARPRPSRPACTLLHLSHAYAALCSAPHPRTAAGPLLRGPPVRGVARERLPAGGRPVGGARGRLAAQGSAACRARQRSLAPTLTPHRVMPLLLVVHGTARPHPAPWPARRVLRWAVPAGAAAFERAPLRVDSGVAQGDLVGCR